MRRGAERVLILPGIMGSVLQKDGRDVWALSGQALATDPELLIWPEAAVPSMPRYDTNLWQAITNRVRSSFHFTNRSRSCC